MNENWNIKEKKKSCEPVWKYSHLSTFIHLDKHLDRARGTLGLKFTIVYIQPLQMKSFGHKIFQISCMG